MISTSPRSLVTSHQRRQGFTLVELLVVIAIIAVLASISFSVVSKMRAKARSIDAVSRMRQIGTMVLGYASENGSFPNEGAYPNAADDVPADTSWDGFVLEYMGANDVTPTTPPTVPLHYEDIFYHPNDVSPVIPPMNGNSTARRSFVMLRAICGESFARVASSSCILGEHPWRTDGRNRVGFKSASFMDINALVPHPESGRDLNPRGKFNFMFADGHIETMSVEDSAGTGGVNNPKGLWTLDTDD